MDDQFSKNDQELHATEIKVLQMKDDSIPRALVPLEDIFDQDDVARKLTILPRGVRVENLNLALLKSLSWPIFQNT